MSLDEANERLRAFQDGIPHLAWTARVDGSKDYVNARWKEYTGRTLEELLDWRWLDLVHPDDRVRHERDWRKAMETGERYQEQLRIRRHDGVYRWHSMRDWPTRGRDGRITHWFGTATDVDDQRQLEDHLRAAKESAESANLAKSDFLAAMSHEIRTPMNGIIGMTSLLLDTTLADDQRIYASDAHASAEHLMVIINSILDFSRVDAGRLQIETAPFNLRDLVEDVCALINEQAYEKHVELTCLIESSVPDRATGDGAKVRQVLLNLIGNGVKFTNSGEVSLIVETVDGAAAGGFQALRFTVCDTGIGMDAQTRQRVFQAFTQGDSSMNRRFGGTGLGLVISKGLVEAMGGTLDLESMPGRGSVFTVTLPFARADDGSRITVAPGSNPARILCVDDNPRVLRSLETHLQRLGVEPICVSDAAQAITTAREAAASGRPFEVIFLDNHLPQMLGLALVRTIMLIPGYSQKPPRCVLLTNNSRNAPVAAGLAQVSLYLRKPFRFRQVRHSLEAVKGVAPIAVPVSTLTEVEQQPALERFRGRRVLVAEDNPVNQRLASHILARLGLVTEVVANGVEAVRAAQLTRYDVILMDCQMPEMDGYEATARIRKSGAGSDVPIVALTANVMPADRQRCFSAGMDHYLAKPISQSALVGILSACLAGNGPATSAGLDPATPPPGHGLPAVDHEVLAALSQSVPEGAAMVRELIDLFKEDTPEQLRTVREAGDRNDGGSLSLAAHRLKSGCHTLGFKVMEALCLDLELAGREDRMDEVVASCDRLKKAYAHVLADLAR